MDSTDSGIFKLASVGSYLDALSSITHEMSLIERSNLIFLDKCLHQEWGLGQNVLLNWCPQEEGIGLLVVPHYAVAAFSAQVSAARGNGNGGAIDVNRGRRSEDFFKSLLSGRRRLDPDQMQKVARLLDIEVTYLPLRQPIADNPSHLRIIEKMIKRYSITYVPSRGVALFDIVGFSLLSPFEQMTQLNSLSYSLNSAQSKLSSKKIGIDFARSTTGDGFYVWNRDLTLDANINLYHFMHLALADNAIARSKAVHNTVPHLRACFHVGGSYEFHQAEGLNPTLYNYIVGDVTVELARIIERAMPDQVFVGEFIAQMPVADRETIAYVALDSIDFVARATQSVEQLRGLELSGERIEMIKCYLTGTRLENDKFTVRRIIIKDKHGISRNVYNAKANIYRRNAEPILLGIEDRVVVTATAYQNRSEHLLRPLIPAERPSPAEAR
jgi:hypothetical protein